MICTILNLADVSFIRKGRKILSDVSWCIEGGEHWGILGPNASGKTTLLKIITGYEWPTSGEVTVLGQKFGDCSLCELRKSIGWVSSSLEHQVPVNDTALEIVASGIESSLGLYRSFSKDEFTRAEKALELLNASDIVNQYYKILSQGEQQKTLIARALVNRPELLILDEPCAGLDPSAREDLLDDLKGLLAESEKLTVILVTHHIEEIAPWISNVMLIKAGKTTAQGTTEQVLTSGHLSNLFGRECNVHKEGLSYTLVMKDRRAI